MKRIVFAVLILTSVAAIAVHARPFSSGNRQGICRDPVMSQLTWEQRLEIRNMVRQMCLDQAAPADVQEAVKSKLESFGIEVPEDWTLPRRGRGMNRAPRMRRIMAQLTDEQRAAVRAKTEQMIEEGAAPWQIREEVGKMLEEFGVQFPSGCRLNSSGVQTEAVMPLDPGQTGQADLITANYPNPFNPETTITYELSEPQPVSVVIYDIAGKRVRTLADGYQSAGSYEVVWDGCDDAGTRLSSGTYFYTVNAGNQTVTKQMILLK